MIHSSWSWPNLFDVARNKVNIYTDTKSIANRVKLLLLTEPTELYMVPNFGVGLRKYMFMYNNDNVPAMIRDELIEQLRLWEPAVIPEQTTVVRTELTDAVVPVSEIDHMRLTITVVTSYMEQVSFEISSNDIRV